MTTCAQQSSEEPSRNAGGGGVADGPALDSAEPKLTKTQRRKCQRVRAAAKALADGQSPDKRQTKKAQRNRERRAAADRALAARAAAVTAVLTQPAADRAARLRLRTWLLIAGGFSAAEAEARVGHA